MREEFYVLAHRLPRLDSAARLQFTAAEHGYVITQH